MGNRSFRWIGGRIINNLQGWKTRRKIIVIESDDWGSIRMPSRETYNACLKAGFPVDKIAYEKYDSLLSQNDLELLFNLLKSFKDFKGKHPVITSNCVVANPDFNKIIDSDFMEYHYELITDTFNRYPNHHRNFQIWGEAIEDGIFYPQYHAREHLNVSLFMEHLRRQNPVAIFAVNNQMPGCVPFENGRRGNFYVEATKFSSMQDKKAKIEIYLDGLRIFEDLFGYKSRSVIPPNYTWSPSYDEDLKNAGVRYIQGIHKMREPIPGGGIRYHNYYTGHRNHLGQIRLVRNAVFEPSLFGLNISDPIGRCLKEIKIAFLLNKPAIITSHRINYVGFIDESNRDRNLRLLRELFSKVLKKWPEIEFMNSEQLGDRISNNQNGE